MKHLADEVCRYAGVPRGDETALWAIETVSAAANPRWVWKAVDLSVPGELAKKRLSGCARVCILCCTLGAEFDRLLRSAQARDMAQAIWLNAAGTALVEDGCDRAQREMAARFPGMTIGNRFSPGYGDLPLRFQKTLCRELDVQRRLGVTLTDTYALNPVKTVTAVVGLSEGENK